jgi:aminoglycoside phosphotransferase family enzyme
MSTRSSPSVQPLIKALATAGVANGIEVIETSMSWVLLAGDHVFKLKKPLRNDWVDLRTIEARHANALAEVSLNRRLTTDVYLGTLALMRQGERHCLLRGDMPPPEGELLDWVVQMRRLPAQRSLDALLRQGGLGPRDIEPLSDALTRFYRHAEPAHESPHAHFRHLSSESKRHAQGLEQFEVQYPALPSLLRGHEAWLGQERELIMRRVAQKRLVDGHGDLRPEHIFLTPQVQIIDCLEFNPRLRLIDPIAELACLHTECMLLGARWIGPYLLARHLAACADALPASLFMFHVMSHALLRARQCAAHLLRAPCRTPDRWQARTRRYLDIAAQALSTRPEPIARNQGPVAEHA